MGAALDSFVILLETGGIVTAIVIALALWRSVLGGNFKTSLIRRKPLLVPSIVFIITILVVSATMPLPMSVYQGPNQIRDEETMSAQFQVFEAEVYESDIEFRVSRQMASFERVEAYANFSQEGLVVRSLFINMTSDSLDENYGVTLSISLDPGLYHVNVITNFYFNDILQDSAHVSILVHQPVTLAFIPELTEWGTIQFILGFLFLFLFLGGLCIGREDKTRRSTESIDQEPPRDELYSRRF